MSSPDFEQAVTEVIGEEAGYVNNPADPGGETKWGISKRTFPNVDIANLTRDAATELYRTRYWDPIMKYVAADAPYKFKLVAFECCVNQGQPKTVTWLEEAKGQLAWFQAERAMAYVADKNFATFGRGWLRRLFAELA